MLKLKTSAPCFGHPALPFPASASSLLRHSRPNPRVRTDFRRSVVSTSQSFTSSLYPSFASTAPSRSQRRTATENHRAHLPWRPFVSSYRQFSNTAKLDTAIAPPTMPPTPPQIDDIALSVDNGICVIKYNRPKSGNSLNTAMLKNILAGLQWADKEESVRVIIQTGEGRFYTAGLDLLDQSNQGDDAVLSDDFIDTLHAIHVTLIKSTKVLIAAVNGPAPGWGTSSLALSDLVYAVPEAFFFTPFVQWGLCAEACSSITFASIMGHQKAAGLILAGDRLTAAELESAGLITRVLPADGFIDAVMKIAKRIAAFPPKTLRMNKELMMSHPGRREALLRANDLECEGLRQNGRTAEPKEAIGGFKRDQERKKREKAKQAKL